MKPRAYVLDDEPLAVRRLVRLLNETNRVELVGHATDSVEAAREISHTKPDVLFLDIQMPALTGFDVLAQLPLQPLVVFTTAYQQYALKAFDVHSVDYLLKPIDEAALGRALTKLERFHHQPEEPRPDVLALLSQVNSLLQERQQPPFPERLPSRLGDKVEFVDVAQVTHFFAQEKLTFAATEAKNHVIDATMDELETRLDPRRFLRVHRSTIVQIAYVHEVYSWFAGRMMIRLKDKHETELTVARERVKALKEKLGI